MSDQQKLDKILEGITEIKVDIARHRVYQMQQRKEIDELTKKVAEHEKTQIRAYTIFAFAGVIVTGIMNYILKHI